MTKNDALTNRHAALTAEHKNLMAAYRAAPDREQARALWKQASDVLAEQIQVMAAIFAA